MHIQVGYLYKILTALTFSLLFLLSGSISSFANSEGSITATVSISVCGNGVVEDGEVCDSRTINGKTCADFGYEKGVLLCGLACDEYNIDSCFNETEGDVIEEDEEVEDEDHELNIEVKDKELSDPVEMSSIEMIPINQMELIELSLTYIGYQEVPLNNTPP